ncbi:CPBP family intramembrane glutamic endopeptidase [Wukongibacter baidiensis]|uniref:CPBP family glutamic-type intramembrane protease n=1 Tax=Wukongibacter baidiensis TaxID=1723361 RepID=UPI003D7F9749
MKKGKVSILETNILYLVAALLLVTIGAYAQSTNIKLGLIITEYILVLLPVIIFLKVKGIGIRKFLRFNKIRVKHGLVVVLVTLLSYPIAAFANVIVLSILSFLGLDIIPSPVPVAENFSEYIVLFFIIAISAGICEEVLFRGLLLRVYEEKYKMVGIVTTAVMFGVFHFNLQNLAAPIVLGLVFGYLVHITDSIYAGIIGHITNNGIAVTLMYGLTILYEKLGQYGNFAPDKNTMPTTGQLIAATVLLGVIATASGTLAFLLIRYLKRDIDSNLLDNQDDYYEYENSNIDIDSFYEKNMDNQIDQQKEEGYRFIRFIPVGIVCVMYIFFSYLQFSW